MTSLNVHITSSVSNSSHEGNLATHRVFSYGITSRERYTTPGVKTGSGRNRDFTSGCLGTVTALETN
jgi:hypothetical protein